MARIPEKWLDPALRLRLRAWAIDPHDFDNVRCEIGEVLPDGSITEGYYSDTRISASIKVKDPSFPDFSWIRLTVDDSDGDTEELATLCIGPFRISESGTGKIAEYNLHSSIWAISEDRPGTHWTIAEATTAATSIEAVCRYAERPYVFLPGFRNHTSGEAVVYEIEDSMSSVLFDICDRSNNRMDVDSHGRLTFTAYFPPSERGVTWEIDERDERSIVLEDDLSIEDSTAEAYGRSIVTWKGKVSDDAEEEVEITAQAEVPSRHPASKSRRGYTRAQVHSESEMSPASSDRASQLARQYLTEDSDVPRTGTITVMWCPIHYGDIIDLTRLDGTSSRWLVQTVDADLSNWEKKLTLKEVS